MKFTLDLPTYQASEAADDLRAERGNGKGAIHDTRRPRFTYAIRDYPNAYGWSHYKRVVFDSVTGAERAFEMDEVEAMGVWRDEILNRKDVAA